MKLFLLQLLDNLVVAVVFLGIGFRWGRKSKPTDDLPEALRRSGGPRSVREPEPPIEFNIVVNAQVVPYGRRRISYEDILTLAAKKPRGARAQLVMTVTWHNPRKHSCGSLLPGMEVDAEAGMVINVSDTSNA